ncbi:caveolin-2 [Cynoglossus semilaevis]|uniref:Caveolin n=1 Tax=Cynoglossus semilaevis TaxID=244447 RepID=A0A3P8X0W7_CYNSE|nr:caveolin-2 [Cynoglossus semilaevis]
MGLEKEKSDVGVMMDDDEFTTAIEPVLSKKGDVYEAAPNRDPNDINWHLKVDFEDVLAEPGSTHSFDRVWICSHAAFELLRFIFYRLLTTLLAVPLAFTLGLMFATLSCVHIWLVNPLIRSFMTLLPSVRVMWRSVTDVFVAPFCHSMGKIWSSVGITNTEIS